MGGSVEHEFRKTIATRLAQEQEARRKRRIDSRIAQEREDTKRTRGAKQGQDQLRVAAMVEEADENGFVSIEQQVFTVQEVMKNVVKKRTGRVLIFDGSSKENAFGIEKTQLMALFLEANNRNVELNVVKMQHIVGGRIPEAERQFFRSSLVLQQGATVTGGNGSSC